MPSVLVTGAAGFIGFHVARKFLRAGYRVIGLDAMTDYYDPALKRARLAKLARCEGASQLRIIEGYIETPDLLAQIFAEEKPEIVVHLAAQAGVRHSIEAPRSYVSANISGTLELLEAARHHPPAHMLLASTSSVYGSNEVMPYRENQKCDTPMSFYAATKKATEAMAHSYAHLYGLPITMFRFFTVYGPWGRPDMALFRFTEAMLAGEPIDVYNNGKMMRDFTYVDDIVEGLFRLAPCQPQSPPEGEKDRTLSSDVAPFRIVNIGNRSPVQLLDFISALEAALRVKAVKNLMPMQPGDVPATWADTKVLHDLTGWRPQTSIEEGVGKFVGWYREYYGMAGARP